MENGKGSNDSTVGSNHGTFPAHGQVNKSRFLHRVSQGDQREQSVRRVHVLKKEHERWEVLVSKLRIMQAGRCAC